MSKPVSAARPKYALSLARCGGAVLFLALSAHLRVPFWPVPMTMQTFAVLMIGASLPLAESLSALYAYLALGGLGLPVFAGAGGIAALLGPTGGYLAGFVLAGLLLGLLRARAGGLPRGFALFAGLVAADALIFAAGLLWLARFVGSAQAVRLGLLPFLLADATKVGLAFALLSLAARRRG
jgi:biotin transport system substrate-specific component